MKKIFLTFSLLIVSSLSVAHAELSIETISMDNSIIVTSTSNFNFQRNLSMGTTGEDVRSLQIFLNYKGYFVAESGNGSPTKETDYFGLKTATALKKFQSANSIPSTGYFGTMTRSKIKELEGR